MKRRVAASVIFVLIVIAAIIVAVIAVQRAPRGETVRLYYLRANADQIGPAFGSETAEAMPADRLVQRLLHGPQSKNLVSPFGEDIVVNAMETSGGTVYIDFNEQYLTDDPFTQSARDYCLVRTLSGMDGVEYIGITVEGHPYPPPDGADGWHIRNFIVDNSAFAPVRKTMTVYFPNTRGDLLIYRQVTVKTQGVNLTENTVLELLANPPKGVASPFAGRFNANSVVTADGVCYVNLSRDILSFDFTGDTQVTLFIYGIVNSLCELDGVRSVRLSIDGQTMRTLAGVDIPDYLTARYDLVE